MKSTLQALEDCLPEEASCEDAQKILDIAAMIPTWSAWQIGAGGSLVKVCDGSLDPPPPPVIECMNDQDGIVFLDPEDECFILTN